MKNTGIAIVSLVGGMIIGSALTMLFTPQSGLELRQKIKDSIDDEIDKVKDKLGKVGHCHPAAAHGAGYLAFVRYGFVHRLGADRRRLFRRPRTPRLPVRDPRRRGTDPQAGRNGLRGGPCSANGLRMARRKGFSVSEAPRGVAEKMKKAGAACCSGFFRPSAKGCAAISARTFAERAFRTCSELRFRFRRFVFRPNVIRPGRKIQTYSRSGRTC